MPSTCSKPPPQLDLLPCSTTDCLDRHVCVRCRIDRDYVLFPPIRFHPHPVTLQCEDFMAVRPNTPRPLRPLTEVKLP